MATPKKTKKYLKSFKEFLGSDLRGQHLTIISHPSYHPTTIVIYAESKNMLVFRDGKDFLMIPKTDSAVYEVKYKGVKYRFSGKYIVGTPRTRRKRRLRRW